MLSGVLREGEGSAAIGLLPELERHPERGRVSPEARDLTGGEMQDQRAAAALRPTLVPTDPARGLGSQASRQVQGIPWDKAISKAPVMPLPPMPLAAGTRLGPYEIAAPIGGGGMGEVCRAHDTKLSRDVAVKVLPEGLSSQPEALARFEREAKAGRRGDIWLATLE